MRVITICKTTTHQWLAALPRPSPPALAGLSRTAQQTALPIRIRINLSDPDPFLGFTENYSFLIVSLNFIERLPSSFLRKNQIFYVHDFRFSLW